MTYVRNTTVDTSVQNDSEEEDSRIVAAKPLFGSRILGWLRDESHWTARVLYSAADRFYWDNGFSRAASLAYTLLLSLLPLTALLFGIFASIKHFRDGLASIERSIILQFVPNREVALQVSRFLMDHASDLSGVSLTMLLFFVVTVILLLNAVEAAFNETWQVFEFRPWANRIGIFSAIILIAPLIVLSAYVTVRLEYEKWILNIHSTYIEIAFQHLLPFGLILSAFAALNYLVPKAPVQFRSALIGAFVSALLFILAHASFAYYLERASYNQLYGAIAAVPIFLVWLYVFWTIVLLGAEVSYQAQHLPRSGSVWKRSVHSTGDGQMLLVFQALIMIARAFQAGKVMPNELEIAEKLGCSNVVLKPALDILERGGILARASSYAQPLTLQKSPECIQLSEVEELLCRGRNSMNFSREMTELFRRFSPGKRKGEGTLLDLLSV